MKRKGNLYDQVCSFENLLLADKKARKGKTHTYGVKKFDQDPVGNLTRLQRALLDQTFRTSDYTIITIHEPKEREIHRLPYYPDRIVHHAIMNIVEKLWVSTFTRDTYSCIKERGIHAASKAVKRALVKDPEGTKYCLKLDVRKFYPSIKHGVLKQIIRKKIKDKSLLWLLDEIIDSAPGVPIGNYLSQYFANLYLAYFDHWIKEVKGVKHYFRYADDMVIFGSSKEQLHTLLREIQGYFGEYLDIQVKDNWQVFPVDKRGLDFLGYVYFHTHVLMRKGIKKNFCRKAFRLNKRKKITEKEYKQAICSWWGWAKYCNSRNLIKKIKTNAKYEIEFRYQTRRAA